MKNIAFFLCLAAATLLTQQAHAYDTPLQDAQSKKIIDATARSVAAYTETLGIKKLVWANIANRGQIVILQYMPEDLEDPSAWTRMLEISVYGLGADPKSDMEAEKRIILGLETQYKRAGEVTADQNYAMNDSKDIGMFIKFTLNKNTPEQVMAAGAFLRITDKAAAYIQLNGRGRPLKNKEAMVIHKLVNPLADQPVEEPTRGRRKKGPEKPIDDIP